MGRLFDFLKRGRATAAARDWHRDWERAVAGLDDGAPARLQVRLREGPPLGEDVEIEQEMLDALRDLLALERDLARAALPAIDTSHRVAHGEPCHFSVPVSMPYATAQPTGRLLLTSGRAAFAGGGRTPALAWHAARDVIRDGRDLIFVRSNGDPAYRFRCNSFTDALCGAAIARYLIRASRQPL
jgi:hypothetical protein